MDKISIGKLVAIIVTVTFCILFAATILKGGILGGFASLLITIAGAAEFLIVAVVAWVIYKIAQAFKK